MARRIAERADSARHPALAGKARWIVGTILGNSAHYPDSRGWYLRAAALLEQAGEEEHAAFMAHSAADALRRSGGAAVADQERHRALLRMRPYVGSTWHLNALDAGASWASEAGLLRAALRYQDERVGAAPRTGLIYKVIEARLARARLLPLLDRTPRALEDLRRAELLIDSLPEFARVHFLSDRERTAARTKLGTQPATAARELEAAAVGFQEVPAILLEVLLTRADAWAAAGQMDSARAALEEAASMLRKQGTTVRADPLRGALFDRARGVFDRLVLTTAATVGHRAALEQLERARAVFAPFPRSASSRLSMPPREVGLSYALVADTLLSWGVVGDSVWMKRQNVNGTALLRTIEIVRSSLERGQVMDTATQAGLAELYDMLIRPLALRTSPDQPSLVIAADGLLASVPFAALYDRTRRRYLIEDYVPRLAATLSGALQTERRAVPSHALLVGNPAFNRRENPGLAPLRGAAAEVELIARRYRAPMRLIGSDADSTRFASALDSAEIVHFSGHAVLDGTRPERSFLLLAGGGSQGRMTAEEIAEMNLRGVRLVVLAACETARGPEGRAGGLAGLSAALLGAGAESVVGSLWRVDDQLTTPLMVAFHREYARTGDAAAALRAAQLTLLRSSDPRLRSPAAWAGFVHLGN